jgi:opacity protein-like surface antigen
MLRRIPSLVVLTGALSIVSVPAFAQLNEPQRGYAIGFGGMGASQVNSEFFGGSVGFNITPQIQITGDISRTQDVLSSFTKEDLTLVDSAISADIGLPFTSSVKMPTNYYVAGVRWGVPLRGNVRPYVSGGGGVAHMSPAPKFLVAGLDMTELAMKDALISNTFREETRPMATVGGGLAVVLARHLTVDFGYKYSAIFIDRNYLQDYEVSPHSHNRIDTHKMYVGAGVAF